MPTTRGLLVVTMLISLLASASGCAPSTEAGVGSVRETTQSPPSQTPPTETEIAIACGVEIVRELASDGYFASRTEAITANLDWHVGLGPDSVQESTHLPNRLYIELYTEALIQLPASEEGLQRNSDLQLAVVKNGVELGTVEISLNAEGRYGITAIGFPATDSRLCEQHGDGGHGG